MKYALENPQSEVSGWTIEKLRDLGQPDSFWAERAALLSDDEKAAILAFLKYAYTAPAFSRYRADCYDGLVCWGEHPNDTV
jgi:hypothetical protein